MAFIVVGGHTRNIGKTQLVVEILRAFPERRWTAAKITQFGHGVCSINGKHCHCSIDEHPYALQEERDPQGRSDTSRMLAAGAAQVFWVRTKQGRLQEALPHFQRAVAGAEDLVVESNTLLDFLKPDLYLPVLDFSRADFKDSARRLLDRADAYVLLAPRTGQPVWDSIPAEALNRKPVFVAWPGRLCPPGLAAFIRTRLAGNGGRSPGVSPAG